MTTLSISLDDAVARRLEARSAEVGQTPEAYAREVLSRVARLTAFEDHVAAHEAHLRTQGYEREEDVMRAIADGIDEVRRTR